MPTPNTQDDDDNPIAQDAPTLANHPDRISWLRALEQHFVDALASVRAKINAEVDKLHLNE